MDIQMPVMDGIEATKEIRRLERQTHSSNFPPTPPAPEGQQTPSDAPSTETKSTYSTQTPFRSSVIIVALTASSLQTDRVAALAAGCNDFLTKPVSLQWLNNKIIEWRSIKALQMWADLRPEAMKSISTEQAVQAQNVARRLHVPEGRVTPVDSQSRSSSKDRRETGEFGAAATSFSSPRAPQAELRRVERSPLRSPSLAAEKHEEPTINSTPGSAPVSSPPGKHAKYVCEYAISSRSYISFARGRCALGQAWCATR